MSGARSSEALTSGEWRVDGPSLGPWRAVGPVRYEREEAERDAEHASMRGALPESPRETLPRPCEIGNPDAVPHVRVPVAVVERLRQEGVRVVPDPRPNEAAPHPAWHGPLLSTLTERGLDELARKTFEEPMSDRKLAILTLLSEVRYRRGLPPVTPEQLGVQDNLTFPRTNEACNRCGQTMGHDPLCSRHPLQRRDGCGHCRYEAESNGVYVCQAHGPRTEPAQVPSANLCFHARDGKRCTRYLSGSEAEKQAVIDWAEAEYESDPNEWWPMSAVADAIREGRHYKPRTSSEPTSPDVELESPNFESPGLAALIKNDFERVNDPRRARLDPDGTAKPKTEIAARYPDNGHCIGHAHQVIEYVVRPTDPKAQALVDRLVAENLPPKGERQPIPRRESASPATQPKWEPQRGERVVVLRGQGEVGTVGFIDRDRECPFGVHLPGRLVLFYEAKDLLPFSSLSSAHRELDALRALAEAAGQYHEDCGHDDEGAATQCDAICDAWKTWRATEQTSETTKEQDTK